MRLGSEEVMMEKMRTGILAYMNRIWSSKNGHPVKRLLPKNEE